MSTFTKIPLGRPQQAIIEKVMNDMEIALKNKKPSKIQQSISPFENSTSIANNSAIESCNPNLPVYVPLFYMPQFETHSSGKVACQDPFWLR